MGMETELTTIILVGHNYRKVVGVSCSTHSHGRTNTMPTEERTAVTCYICQKMTAEYDSTITLLENQNTEMSYIMHHYKSTP